MYVQMIFCSVRVAEWLSFEVKLLHRLQYILFVQCLFAFLAIFLFFDDMSLVLIEPVPGHCLHFTFLKVFVINHFMVILHVP